MSFLRFFVPERRDPREEGQEKSFGFFVRMRRDLQEKDRQEKGAVRKSTAPVFL